MKHYNIPIFIPELACPFQCIYCNQKTISGVQKIPSLKEVESIIENHLSTIDYENSDVEIAFFGGNFTGLSINNQIKYLRIAQKYVASRKVKSIRLSTRPDYIDDENLEILKSYGVRTIELGVQSFDDDVLKLSERGYTSSEVFKAISIIKKMRFKFGLQMMVGLPGDTEQKSIETAKKIAESGADNTRIYPTLVIKNTKLESLYKQGFYKPLELNDALNIVKQLILIFENANIKIIKIGLHPSDKLIKSGLIAGPFHLSFRQLCETEIWYDLFYDFFSKNNIDNHNFANIYVSPDKINDAVGYQTKNKKYLLSKFKNVRFLPDNKLKNRDFHVHTY